jgi:predicted choloylglycine hydrolase
MGSKYGATLYKHGFRLQEQNKEKLDFAQKCEAEVKRVFPEILEEIQGFANAAHSPYEHLSALINGVGAFKPPAACSVFASSAGSDVLFGRNYDFYYSFKDHLESYFTRPSEGFSSVGDTDIFVGREDGVNEKGLAIAMTAVKPTEVKPGINFALLTRCVLDKCASVEEAIRVLVSARHVTANNFLVADREGNMAVVEACPNRVKVRKPSEDGGFVVCTNHFNHTDMGDMENLKERPSDSLIRYATIHDKLQLLNGTGGVRDAQKILSDHHGLVCSHIEQIKLGTLWSVVATLKKPLVYRAEGHPCKTGYKVDRRLRARQSNQTSLDNST